MAFFVASDGVKHIFADTFEGLPVKRRSSKSSRPSAIVAHLTLFFIQLDIMVGRATKSKQLEQIALTAEKMDIEPSDMQELKTLLGN